MEDYSNLSEEELERQIASLGAEIGTTRRPDYSSMSEDELTKQISALGSEIGEGALEKQIAALGAEINSDTAKQKLSGAKEGDFVAVQGRDGKVSLKKVNAPSDGASVLEDVDDVPDMNKTYPTLTADEWDAARESGSVKMNVSPSRYRQLQQIAETGSELFDKTSNSVAADVVPFGGRGMLDEERSKIEGLVKLSKGDNSWNENFEKTSGRLVKGTLANTGAENFGKVQGKREPTEAAKKAARRIGITVEEFIANSGNPEQHFKTTQAEDPDKAWERGATRLGIDPDAAKKRDGESSDEYRARIGQLADERAKHLVSRQDWAKKELSYIDKDWKDTVFGEGRASVGYAGEFAMTPIPMGGVVKGASVAAKIGRGLLKTAVQAQPVAISHAISDYEKFRENGYTMKNGELEIETKGDDPERALFKAIANNEIESITEIGLGELSAPILKVVGKTIGKRAWGKPIVAVAKEYAKIREATKFGDILFEELPEENVQYFFSDILGLGKKDSEFRGIMGELAESRKDGGMYTLKGQWNTALAMLLQMGGQAAVAAPGAGLQHIENNRQLANVLEGTGMTKEQVANLSYGQREAFRRFYNKFADNPEKLKEALVRFDQHLAGVADEIVAQTTMKLGDSVKSYGETPHLFEVQTETGPDGKRSPKFRKSIHTDGVTGKTTVRREMLDPKAGVTVVDNGVDEDGNASYEVYDEVHPERSYATSSFDEAMHMANVYSLQNQRLRLENQVKEQYFNTLTQGKNAKFKRGAESYHTVGDLLRVANDEIRRNGNFHGSTSLDGLFVTDENGEVLYPPRLRAGNDAKGVDLDDGSIAVILDNINSAAEMNSTLAHESSHAAGKTDAEGNVSEARQKERKEQLSRIAPESELGQELARIRAINDEKGSGYSDEKLREEALANWMQMRGHNPSVIQRVQHALFGKFGNLNDADWEVIASRMERETANANGNIENMPTDVNTESTPVEGETTQKETPDETGNGADEAPAQPEQGTVGRQEGEEVAQPGAAEVPRGEAPREGVVEKPKELPTDKDGYADGEIGDSIELDNGMKATVTARKGGGKRWSRTQGPRWTSDGGKTWHDGLKPGDRFSEEDYDNGKVPSTVHFSGQSSITGIWEVEYITNGGEYELRPVAFSDGKSAAAQKPVSERNIVEKLTDQAPVQELPVAEVVNDDSRIPNFKEGANPETGEVEPLTGEPYDLVSNPIVVMEFKDGKKVVVTGRHRLALYKRSGRKTIAARVIREADGWTVDDAKAIDAIGNIIDEKGTVKDYVNYFNNAKPTRAEAKAGGFLDRPKGQRAFGIFEGATEATKSVIDWNGTGGDGLISADQAGIIAEAAPKGENKRNGAVQRILVQKALAGLRGKKLGILARSLAEEAKTRKETPNVGGEMQLDLFTSEDDQKLLALEEKRSDYRVKKSEEYGRIAEVLRTALAKGGKLDLNADYAKELGITDPNDRKQLAAARDKAVERANYWETAVSLDEADKAAMDADINAAAEAGAKKREAAKAKVEAIKAKREGKAAPAAPKAETSAPAPKKPTERKESASGATPSAKRTIVMKDEAAEKKAKAALDAIDFAYPEFAPDASDRIPLGAPYQGSKNRIARRIVGVLPAGKRFVDLFSGGGAVTHAAMLSGKYETYRMNDASPMGQRLFVEGVKGKWRNYGRTVRTDEEFDAIRGTPEGLAWSFNGLGRNLAKVGEDGRDRAREQIRRVQGLEALKPFAGKLETSEVDYSKVKLRKGDVVYADIPYEGTDQQGYRSGEFDKERFAEWAQRQNTPIFVSEYSMPGDWREVSAFDVPGMRGGNRTEKLFVQEKFADSIHFAEPAFNPDNVKDRKERRQFDVLKPNGEIVTVEAESRKQAQYLVDKNLYKRVSFPDGGEVHEQGGAEYAIITLLRDASYGSYLAAQKNYNDAGRVAGALFLGALRAGITHARTKNAATLAIRQALGDGMELGRGASGPAAGVGGGVGGIARLAAVIAGKTERVTRKGWRYFADGTVVVPVFDGRDKTASRAFFDILTNNSALGSGYRVTDYAEDSGGKLYAILSGPKVESIPDPLFEDKPGFLREHGFTKVENTRFGDTIWEKKLGTFRLTLDSDNLRLAMTDDGKKFALRTDMFGGTIDPNINFADPAFDPERFGKLVTGVGKLVDVLVDSGHRDFKSLATYIREMDPAKYERAKPVLQDVWNAVARARKLARISDGEADEVYGIIETAEGGNNGNVRQSGNADEGDADRVQELRPAAPAPASGREGRGAVAPKEVQGGDGQPVLGGVPGESGQPVGDGRVAGELLERREVRNAPAELHEAGGQGNAQEGAVPAQGAAESGGRRAEGSGPRGRLESGASDSVQPGVEATNPEEAAHKASPDKPSNYVITDEDEAWLNGSTPGEKIANNIEVIRILNDLEGEGRMPTPEEKTKMARYVGFGGFPQALDLKYKDAYEKYGGIPSGDLPVQTQAALKKLRFGLKGYDNYVQLRELLTPEEFEALTGATKDAFYTTIDVCRAIHAALKASGFNGGRMLETSAGVGNFIGTGDYEMGANWTAVELDKTTGKILGYLYPLANVKVQGFEETQIPRGFMDAAVSNVPFGQQHLYDPEYNKQNFPIHDHFIARGVDRLRVGGVAAFITSTGTLDKMDKSLIRYLEENGGKIVGAVRLPHSYQSKNAGTDVASDIIFIQKVKGKADNSTFARNGDMFGIRINGYFAERPEMIFATVKLGVNKLYGGQPALEFVATKDLAELPALVKKAAEDLKYVPATEVPQADPIALDADKSGLRRGNIGIVDGKIVKREGDMLVTLDVSKIKWPKKFVAKGYTLNGAIKQFVDLRKAYYAYVDAQKNGTEDDVKLKRATLNAAYDAMIARYKSFNNEKAMRDLFDLDDADGIVLQQLEAYDLVPDGTTPSGKPKTKKANFRKSDALKKRTLFGATKATKADTPMDGLRISINECGRVNIPRIAELTGLSVEDVKKQLIASGHVFQNPSTGEFETRDEYLSGSVRRKLREARAAAEVDPMFNKNVEELEKVQPEDKPATKIKYQMGQRFIPNDMYRDFLAEVVFGCNPKDVTVGYDEKADSWRIEGRIVNAEYARRSPIGLDELLKRIFNGSPLTIKDRVEDGGGKYHYVLNPQKTQQAESLRDDLTAAMSKWLVATPERAQRVMRSYNDLMNDDVPRKWDPDLITLDGISDTWKERANTPGYEHQKRTIARGVLGGNLCIAHCVGAGKSFEMFSICMQLRRLGLARKPMLTVPNHMVESGQVYKEFMEAYPGARVLVATSRDLSTANRRKFLAKAANGDWDCIVVPHSSFSLIGMDPKVQAEYIRREIEDLREMMEVEARESGKKGNAVKRIEKKITSKTEKMKKLLDASKKDSTVPFENIGVDYLLVDEAHNFKGLDITTRMQNVSGVTGSVSQRAQDMEMKCRYLSKLHGGDKGVIFASGTIISNSISEMYTTMRFLSPLKMEEMGVRRFDDWARAFGIVETKPMPRASGKGYQEKTRFAKFQNLVEMKKFFHSFADVVLDEDLNIPRPKMIGGKPIVHKIAADPTQVAKVEELDKRLDSFKGGYDPKIDNPLKVVTEGRLVAIDPSLLGLKSEHRRLEAAADQIYREWKESTGKLAKDGKTVLDGTQLVFCDSGVPKPKKFSKVVKTEDGGFATKSGNYWQLYISPVDAKGLRYGRAKRSDGAEISFKPFIDHSRGDTENIADVYAAFDEMSQAAADYNAENKLAEKKHAAEPVGTPFDINKWLDENAIDLGYDIRFENPFAGERGETTEDIGDEDEETEEEISEEEDESVDQDEKANGDVAVENMLRGRFNVYAHLKQLLVKRGIPESDIAFIHDAENADAKRALFADFNGVNTNFRGGKRILIGNTPKMGEGANVQKRLVDIHHLDVPWKPAWLIQRDGRGIRAGNLNAEIGIHRYVTEGTFDVYSYDKVSTKQQFINQAMNHDLTLDEVEDVDDAVLSAEEAKAAAAGPLGKYMLERVKLTEAMRKADLTLANQQSDIRNAQLGLDYDKAWLDDAVKAVDAAKERIAKYNEAKGDKPFGIEVTDKEGPFAGKTITENDEIAQFLADKVNFFVRKGQEDGIIGKLYGFPIWWHESRSSNIYERTGEIDIPSLRGENERTPIGASKIPLVNRVAVITKGTVALIKSSVTRATGNAVVAEAEQAVAYAQHRFQASADALAKMTVDESLPGKIDDMKVRLAEVNDILGIKDEKAKKEAVSILEERVKNAADEKTAALLEKLKSTEKPVEREIADREKEERDNIHFADPAFDPDRATVPPTPEEDKKFYGFTNDEVAEAMKAAGMEPPKHVKKPDETLMRQADTLLSNREYMRKLAHAVFQKARATRDYENVALGIYADQTASVLNETKTAYDEMAAEVDSLPADTDAETEEELKKQLKLLKLELAKAQRDFREASIAKMQGASEQGRALRSNRIAVDALDYSYAGLRGMVQTELGGREIPEEMDAEIGRLAENFKDLDEEHRKLAVERLKAFSQKVVADMKRGDKTGRMTPRGAGNELKRVTKNYNDALTQVEVHADEAGGTLIGLADQLYPSWGKWLRAIGEYHCYMNPDITEQGVIDAIRSDIGQYLEDGIDEETVRDILTGFGQNYRQSRYDSQRKMNDLKAQSLAKRQRDYMLETGKLPPQTGMVRDEPSDETRALRKEVQELKKDIDQQEGSPRALKGALDAAKTRVRNQIADLERAILRGEQIERSRRTIAEDAELKMLKQQRDELRKSYDEMFGSKSTLTDEQRRARAEKALEKVLERAIERLGRARAGDFSNGRGGNAVTSERIEELRNAVMETNAEIRALKKAAFPEGTPEEQAKRNAKRMQAREKAILRVQDRILSGDIRPTVRKAPPMPPEMQKQYDAMGKELKRAHQKLRELRREARESLRPAWVRKVGDAYRFVDAIWKMATASLDLTQVGNQTGAIAIAHPGITAKSFKQSLSSFTSEANAENIELDLLSDPTVKEAVDNKWLHWKKAGDFGENRGDRVEFFDAIDRGFKIGGKTIKFTDIPVYGTAIANSDRLYATYINTVSANLYSFIVNDPGLFPKGASTFEKKMVADMINVMNGSGTLSKNARSVIGKVFWAPGLVDSQLKRHLAYTVWHPWLASSEEDGSGTTAERARLSLLGTKEFLKSHIGAMLLGGLLFALFARDDEKDKFKRASLPQKAIMLMAPRVGHTQLDFTGGEASFMRLGNKLATGVKESGSGRKTPIRDYFGEVAHFARGRVTPLISNAFAAMSGADYAGQNYGAFEVLASFAPISLRDASISLWENGVEDGEWETAALAAALTMTGFGKGTYRKDDYKMLSNRFRDDYGEVERIMRDPLMGEEQKKEELARIRAANNLMKPENAAKVMAVLKRISSAESELKRNLQKVEIAEVKGVDTAEARKRLEAAAQNIAVEKGEAVELIRASR